MSDIAAFDFDGTLTRGGSVFPFLVAVAGRGRVLAATAALSPGLALAATTGGDHADRAKESLFVRVLGGTDAEQFDAAGVAFARHHLRTRLRPDAARRLAWHQARGDRIVIVSASPESYVREAGRLLGVDGVVATQLAVEDGRITGYYEGKNCRGPEKLRRLQEWAAASGEAPDRIWAYGNSRGDLRMLDAADVAVNAGRLGRYGRLRRYPGLGDAPGRSALAEEPEAPEEDGSRGERRTGRSR